MKKVLAVLFFLMLTFPFFSQEAEPETNKGEGFWSSTMDFLVNGPYFINIGCEPSTNKGAKTFGSLEYKWTPKLSSQIYFEKGNDFIYEGNSKKDGGTFYYNIDTTDYLVKVFPYKRYYFLEDTAPKFSVSLGLALEHIKFIAKTNGVFPNTIYGEANIDNKYFAIYSSNFTQKIFFTGPCIEFEYTYPISDWINFRAEHSFIPLYIYNIKLANSYSYLNYKTSPEKNFSDSSLATGLATLTVHLDFFELFGAVLNYEFARIPNYTYAYDTSNEFHTTRYMNINNSLKVGIALLESTNTFVRIQTGFYREYKWTKTSLDKETQFSKTWTLSVSIGF